MWCCEVSFKPFEVIRRWDCNALRFCKATHWDTMWLWGVEQRVEALRRYALTRPLKCYKSQTYWYSYEHWDVVKRNTIYTPSTPLIWYHPKIFLLHISLKTFHSIFVFWVKSKSFKVCVGFSICPSATPIEFSTCFLLRTTWQYQIVLHFE